jgi:hypothetical protein
MADESQDTLARLTERLARLDRERERIIIAIQVIKNDGDWSDGSAPSGPSQATAESPSDVSSPSLVTTSGRRPEIRPDTFFGQSQHQAARRYLQLLGHADRIENISKAISAGGVEVGGANPTQTLRATLAQNTSVFVKVSPGTFGLREFYPQLGSRGTEPSSRKQRGPRRAKVAKKQVKKRGPQAKLKPKPKPKTTRGKSKTGKKESAEPEALAGAAPPAPPDGGSV